jgi:hypothetical protein
VKKRKFQNNIGIYSISSKNFQGFNPHWVESTQKDMMCLDIKYKLYSIIFIFDVNNFIGYI